MFAHSRSRIVMWCAAACIVASFVFSPVVTPAQGGNLLRNNSVGGISVNVEGVVGAPDKEESKELRKHRIDTMMRIGEGLGGETAIRKISLKRLEAAIDEALRNNISGTPFDLPDAVRYLGGLQRVEYIFVYPEQNDVVLAGPGEGWMVDEQANIVGVNTGRPVLLLEDLIVALRYIRSARQEGISCSIDPTPEGRRNLQAFLNRQKQFSQSVVPGVEKSLGMQNISITGVPAETHLARVMVSSDYRMKRISMKLDPSPVSGLSSFLDLMKSTRGLSTDMMPRWWLACNYRPLAKADDGLAWQIRGPGVKAMTENDLISASGDVTSTGAKNPVAQKWADMMTEMYGELSVQEPVFGQLRNVMDLCVVAALMDREGLLDRANLSLPLLTDPDSKLGFDPMPAPKQVPSQCSYMKKDRSYIITASGGVDVDAWGVIEQSETDPAVGQQRASATPDNSAWWWN